MASTDASKSSGEPFDIVETATDNVTLVGSEKASKGVSPGNDAPKNWLGYILPWKPIPSLRELFGRLFPPQDLE